MNGFHSSRHYGIVSIGKRIAMGCVATLCSATVLGTSLGLFHQRADETGTARGPVVMSGAAAGDASKAATARPRRPVKG